VAREFDLHELAVEDTVNAHQRPKLEWYDDTTFVVLRPARYVDPVEVITLGEVHLFLGPEFAITVRHADEPNLAVVRKCLEGEPELLAHGPYAVLWGVLDRVVDDYLPVLQGLQDDIDQIEEQVFNGDAGVSKRIYQLTLWVPRTVSGPLSSTFASSRRRGPVGGELF
jgi:magnesium transporter